MPSRVALMNRALRVFAGNRIVDPAEEVPEAVHCNAAFDDVRDAVLAEYPWGFATRWSRFAAHAVPPPWGYAHAYALPADILRLVDIRSADNVQAPLAAWQVVGDAVYTNAAPCLARYVFQHENTALWPPQFCEAFCLRLAAEVAPYLGGDAGMGVKLMGRYQEVVRLCVVQDMQGENPAPVDVSYDFITARGQ